MKQMWEVTQEIKTVPRLNKPVFIEGLPGIGNVGKIAVDFLIEELGAKKIYCNNLTLLIYYMVKMTCI